LLVLAFLVLLIGCESKQDPQRLLATASNSAEAKMAMGEHSSLPADEIRLDALRVLLRLQSKTFGVTIAPIKAEGTTGIDHIFIKTLRLATNTVTLLATPSQIADRKAPEGDYWSMEELTFEKSGKLLSRQAYRSR
jgi:hypothetical protein